MQDIRLFALLPALIAFWAVSFVGEPAHADCTLIQLPPATEPPLNLSCWSPPAGQDDFTLCDSTGTIFRGADLSGATFYFAQLDGIDASAGDCSTPETFDTPTSFDGADLRSVRIQDANLTGADFTNGADLDSASLLRSDFSDADFTSTTPGTSSSLSGARISGANFDGADLSSDLPDDAIDLSGIQAFCIQDPADGEFVCTSLNRTDFTNADLRQSRFIDAEMFATRFEGADLRGAWLIGLTENLDSWHPCCVFDPDTQACAPEVEDGDPALPEPGGPDCIDFTGALMQGVAMPETDFTLFWDENDAVDLSDADLSASNFRDLDMTQLIALNGVTLVEANLAGANFSGEPDSDCADADDTDCMRMIGADLLGAALSSSDGEDPPTFSLARFENVDLTDAQIATEGLTAPCQTRIEDVGGEPEITVECVSFQDSLLRGATLRGVDFVELEGFDFETSLVKDLSGADLDAAKLSTAADRASLDDYDLSGANLANAQLDYASFANADLSGANLAAASLAGSVFGQPVQPAKLWGATLDGATLCESDGGAPPTFTCAEFDEASFFEVGGREEPVRMRSLDFTQSADMLGIQSFELLDFSGASLQGKDLTGITSFDRAVLAGADLSGVDFGAAVLDGVDLSGATLAGTQLDGETLSGVDFSTAKLAGVNLNDVDLCSSGGECATFGPAQSFERVRMRRVDFTTDANASWAGRCFAGADVTDAFFTGLDLTGSSFVPAAMQAAVLSGADLLGATLHGVRFDGADLAGIDLDGADYCPDVDTVPGGPWLDPCESPPSTATSCASFSDARLRRASLPAFPLAEFPEAEQADFFQQVAKTGGGDPAIRPDLVQVDLTLANLVAVTGGIDLSNAELEQAALAGVNLTGAILTDANLGRALGGCIEDTDGVQGTPGLTVCTRFIDADMRGVRMVSASFPGSDLAGATFVDDARAAVLDGVDLSGSTLQGAALGKAASGVDPTLPASLVAANLSAVKLCDAGDVAGCAKLGGATLRDANLSEIDFTLFEDDDFFTKLATRDIGDGEDRIDLGAVNLQISMLPNAQLSVLGGGGDPWIGALLERSLLEGADLSGADLRYARLARATSGCLVDANGLQGVADARVCTRLVGAQLSGADLSRGTWTEVNLTGAGLGAEPSDENEPELGPLTQAANLADSTFEDADFTRTDLRYAILDRSVFTGTEFALGAETENGFCTSLSLEDRVDLRGASLLGAKLTDAQHFNEGCIVVDKATYYDDETAFPDDFSEELKGMMVNVPEPGALLSQIGALAGLSLLARKRRARRGRSNTRR